MNLISAFADDDARSSDAAGRQKMPGQRERPDKWTPACLGRPYGPAQQRTYITSSQLMIIQVVGLNREVLALAVHLHAGNMVCPIRKLAELGGYRHCIFRIVEIRRNVKALNGLPCPIEDYGYQILRLDVVGNEQL